VPRREGGSRRSGRGVIENSGGFIENKHSADTVFRAADEPDPCVCMSIHP